MFLVGPKIGDGKGNRDVVVVMRDPQALREGKDSWPYVNAWNSLFGHFLEKGHASINLTFYCFDRALFTRLVRLLKCSFQAILHHKFPEPIPRA